MKGRGIDNRRQAGLLRGSRFFSGAGHDTCQRGHSQQDAGDYENAYEKDKDGKYVLHVSFFDRE